MNADGSNQTRLTNNSVGDFQPDWSPDGTKIVFERAGVRLERDFVMNADVSGSRRSYRRRSLCLLSRSPKGRRSRLSVTVIILSVSDICVMKCRRGVTFRRLTHPPPDFRIRFNPAWSPDGTEAPCSRKLAFASSRSCMPTTLCDRRGRQQSAATSSASTTSTSSTASRTARRSRLLDEQNYRVRLRCPLHS